MADKYSKLKVKELQELLQKHGLPHSGKKDELIDRLVKHDDKKMDDLALEEELGNLEEFDEAKLEELAQDPEFKAMQAVDTEKQNTESVAKVENTTETPKEPEVQVKPGSDFKFTPIKFDAPAETTSAKDTAAKSEAEKRLERAKRFGVPVKEEVKKELRAQKFSSNTSPAEEKSPSPVAKHVETDDALKKRAERFGLPTKNQKPAGGKAAQAKPAPVLDPAEEEKKRKRAERFGKPAEPVKKAKV
ncbi:hypothetical protein BGW37DRAFT_492668 [Umbelopsis sp. PMI_123]|nr:hypothetical protein BGW37DRAFT_492668 [Umbelopsis sp. PMI_123]